MNVKFLLYLFILPFVMYALDGININAIFKKNKVLQAKIFYLFIILALTYLLVNFIFDFYEVSKIL